MLRESMPRLQKYFSRKISDKARDTLTDKLKHREGANLATPEPRRQALSRLPPARHRAPPRGSSRMLLRAPDANSPATGSGARVGDLDCAFL